jgi:pimeloyl-ACP methyl ester carboxylesterase
MRLATGAELRQTGPGRGDAVICVNGGQAAELEGTWSATLEFLVDRLAPRFPALRFAEVRYRVKSWRRLEECIEDARAAIREVAAPRTLLLGFSMGGAVSIACASEPSVVSVLGLAPWIPDRLSVEPLGRKRLRVLHGSLDRYLPGVPGVSPRLSRRGFDRALGLGATGEYTTIGGGLHGVAVRGRAGKPVRLLRAGRWAELVADELDRFVSG